MLSASCCARLVWHCSSIGRAYHYLYLNVGEGITWLIGRAIILEYTIDRSVFAWDIFLNPTLFSETKKKAIPHKAVGQSWERKAQDLEKEQISLKDPEPHQSECISTSSSEEQLSLCALLLKQCLGCHTLVWRYYVETLFSQTCLLEYFHLPGLL